jgi:hypothetical protein
MTRYMSNDEGPTETAEWIADLQDRIRELEDENKRLQGELARSRITVLPEVIIEPA